MRARLALCVSKIAVTHREVDLKNRPEELYAISPKGTVPVLDFGSTTPIEESLEIMLWCLGTSDPADWLQPTDGSIEEVKDYIWRWDDEFKPQLDRYKYPNRFDDADPIVHRELASRYLIKLNQRLVSNPFLFGGKPGLADMAILPFVRQFAFTDRAWFDAEPWPKLREWLDQFTASPLFAKIMIKRETWLPDAPPLFIDWV
ncbi:MAG: glutathione S-transferase [Planctomycetota bacterium]|jgi:glutathione S-transferase